MSNTTDLDKPGYFAIKWGGWGKAHTIPQAKKNAGIKSGEKCVVYKVPFALKDIHINDFGDIFWPKGAEPAVKVVNTFTKPSKGGGA